MNYDPNPLELSTSLVNFFDLLITKLQPNIICDIGALNGIESLRFRKLAPDATLYAFEANPLNYLKFSDWLASHNYSINYEYLAITDVCKPIEFNILKTAEEGYDWRGGASSILNRINVEDSLKTFVPCSTLDKFMSERHLLGKPNCLWIDVEGAAYQMLQGAIETLKETQFLKVEVEKARIWENQKLDLDVIQLLESYDFQAVCTTFHPTSPQYDLVFIKQSLAQYISDIIPT